MNNDYESLSAMINAKTIAESHVLLDAEPLLSDIDNSKSLSAIEMARQHLIAERTGKDKTSIGGSGEKPQGVASSQTSVGGGYRQTEESSGYRRPYSGVGSASPIKQETSKDRVNKKTNNYLKSVYKRATETTTTDWDIVSSVNQEAIELAKPDSVRIREAQKRKRKRMFVQAALNLCAVLVESLYDSIEKRK